jgi:hypothetical protein
MFYQIQDKEHQNLLGSIITATEALKIWSDSKLLSGFPWPLNGNPYSDLESSCTPVKCCQVILPQNMIVNNFTSRANRVGFHLHPVHLKKEIESVSEEY